MLVPHKITALEQSNDPNVNTLNTVVGAVVRLLDLQGQAVLLYDDESGSNPSTAKTTDVSGQVVVWVTAGEYDEAVNGSTLRRVLVGNKGITTEQLIDRTRKALDGDIINTTGFTSGGDGGGAQWKATSTTGLTPSQTPAERGAAELVDGSGRLWEFAGNALFLVQIGATLDGVTIETDIINAALSWSNSAGKNIYIGAGTVLCGNIPINGLNVRIYGLGRDKSIIKIAPNTNDHGISLSGGASVVFEKFTIDHDRDNQTGGHAIRMGGTNKTHFSELKILNADDYAIGVQGGTNLDMEWHGIHIENVGLDGIDIKNYNMDNDIANISNIRVINHGLDSTQSAGIDVRGKYNLTNAVIKPSAGSYGLRTRVATVQGPPGIINATNVHIEPYGTDTDGIALDLAGDGGQTSISNVTVENMSMLMRLNSASTGGCINNLTGSGIFGNDCMSLDGENWLINNIKVENTASSSRVFDVEAGSNIRLSNVNLVDNNSNAASARIQSGSTNFQIDGGFVSGGTIADSGADSLINVTYI